MLKPGKKVTGIILVGLLLAMSVIGGAFADSDTQSPPSPPPDQSKCYQEFIAEFAANLGISEDQVKAAIEATKAQIVQEEVTQGKITQEQADKILAEEGMGFLFGMGGPGHGPGPDGNSDQQRPPANDNGATN